MRYSASEKFEIIRTVETAPLPVRRTLDKIRTVSPYERVPVGGRVSRDSTTADGKVIDTVEFRRNPKGFFEIHLT